MLLHELGASCSMFRWWKKKDIFRKFDRNSSLFIIWLVRCQIEGKMIIRNPINENWIYSVIVLNTKSRNRFFYECFYWDYCGDNVTYMFCIHARKDVFTSFWHKTSVPFVIWTEDEFSFQNIFHDWTYHCINGEHCEVCK